MTADLTLALETLLVVTALLGSTVSSAIGAYLTFRFGQRASRAAVAAQVATAKAQEDASIAQQGVIAAARGLVEAAKTTTPLLVEISQTGKATHQLVNNDRSIAVTRIAVLTELVARLMPGDADAAQAAIDARAEADRLPKPTA